MEELRKILAQVLGVDGKEISEKSSPDNIESWDSFNSLVMIAELERNFDLKFTTDEILAVKNAGDIVKILKNHNISSRLLKL